MGIWNVKLLEHDVWDIRVLIWIGRLAEAFLEGSCISDSQTADMLSIKKLRNYSDKERNWSKISSSFLIKILINEINVRLFWFSRLLKTIKKKKDFLVMN